MSLRAYLLIGSFAAVMAGFSAFAIADEPPKQPGDADGSSAVTEAAATPKKFMRLSRDANGRLQSMDTAVVRFVPADEEHPGLTVDLISAVHIGEKSYYEQLNKLFTQYDALLYELVAPEGTRVPEGGAPGEGGFVATLQTSLKDVLDLEYQLEVINYQQDNFVHADMSPEEFFKSMSDRGESLMTMFLKAMEQASAQQHAENAPNPLRVVLSLMLNKNKTLAIKRLMAEQFEDMESTVKMFNGPDGSTIITERNKKALQVLSREIAAGKKRIGIFYGGGHLRDMEERLVSEFGLKREGEHWIVAWNLRAPEQNSGGESRRAADQGNR